ncbi:hypothetical protein FGB62_403g01 [Gracilaria domingensis]|nr:hypothetical protein FGB62_444g00 [Gracilaria domingensis]KAI0556793.1 hypothetical protein FGB62_403g01 [Gracilaria domingensis]
MQETSQTSEDGDAERGVGRARENCSAQDRSADRYNAVQSCEPIQRRNDSESEEQDVHSLGRRHGEGNQSQSQVHKGRKRAHEDDFCEESEGVGDYQSHLSEEDQEYERCLGRVKKSKKGASETQRNSNRRSTTKMNQKHSEASVGSDEITPVPISKGCHVKGRRKRRGSRETLKNPPKNTKRQSFRPPRSRKSFAKSAHN